MNAQRSRGRAVPKGGTTGPSLRIFYAILALIAVVGGVVLVVMLNRAPSIAPSSIPVDSAVHPLNAPVGVTPDGFYYKGSPDAPVKVIEYADFQCPACALFTQRLEPLIDQQYVETGKIQYIYHDFPLPQHGNAIPTAAAARCAGEQNQFWAMHNLLFSRQQEWENDRNIQPRLLTYADELKLNRDAFGQCLASDKYTSALQQAAAASNARGVTGTPTFDVGGQLLSAPDLQTAIEAALKGK